MEQKTDKPPRWTDTRTLETVRPLVREILQSTPSYRELPEADRLAIAQKMVKVAAYMANPDGLLGDAPPDTDLAEAMAGREDPVTATKRRLSEEPGFAGEDFQAGALEAGTEQFGELVKKVDFPKFVSGLIQNVFQAIVESSIEQMRAYGELLANVAKSVDEFARDNITENNARDWLADQFPDKLGIETSQSSFGFEEGEEPPPQARLTALGDPAEVAAFLREQLKIKDEIADISDAESELKIVTAARMQMARSRQQLLASMVTLGINRIVVTSGLIHAKVIFDVRASDVARRKSKASMYDKEEQKSKASIRASYGGWFTPWSGSMRASTESSHVATVESSVDEESESRAEMKAKLSGEVRVNFKSDYLPMEKLASPTMMAVIQGNAKPVDVQEEATTGT